MIDENSMRESLRELLALQRSLRAEVQQLLERQAEHEQRFEVALNSGGPLPDEDPGKKLLGVMRRLSALNKEILKIMDRLPEYDPDEEPGSGTV